MSIVLRESGKSGKEKSPFVFIRLIKSDIRPEAVASCPAPEPAI